MLKRERPINFERDGCLLNNLKIAAILGLMILLFSIIVPKLLWNHKRNSNLTTFQQNNLSYQELGRLSDVRIIVLVDNEPSKSNMELKAAWGISLYVKARDVSFLFDTGPSPEVLEHNCRVLGVDLSNISFVFISHEHGDHTGGLPYIAKMAPNVPVYVPSGMSHSALRRIEDLGLNVIEVEGPLQILEGVASTGPLMSGSLAEHGLILNLQGKGMVLLVGCAHPGVDRMLLNATIFSENIFGVIGGFHLTGASETRLEQIAKVFKDLNLRLIVPLHCSGKKAKDFFKERFAEAYLDAQTGSVIELDP